jgi:two-component system response regulator GlrR
MAKHILTIDDEAVIRELLYDVLTAAGYRVTGVGSAAEALRVVHDDPPQVVITDLQLEETDGFDLIDRVKAAAPHLPIILLTGVLFDPAVIRGPVGAKIAAYVEKTEPLDRVLREVRRQLGE